MTISNEEAEQAVRKFQQMRQEVQNLLQKIAELENDRNEHTLVIDAIKDLDPSRRCFRLVGSVLVERTVKEVMPAVSRNRDGLDSVIGQLSEQLRKKETDLHAHQTKYKIKIQQGPSEGGKDDGKPDSKSSQGVLV
mmetsp:Transcript_10805/g.17691  ORF Transcript_10805/g.17691 Transcript_10805/m.17691 type:complete len:136 (-) Transcript_10805:206-613(-)|eukprot:CAMPEP_0184656956 /NCGR_PEP_ID=MMETSP0308-20130426/16872_1 /TAXON_ID=38269 /ORGANISM="Gloeochaete witrockiana, Strain SAG 46.84" /LENGTH=135 /DNA_ID=CAMNT_0027094297 /DNA_START=53 /DNA_END=460 /DNA_ORIENTATION=-